jgi:hypothetical protein
MTTSPRLYRNLPPIDLESDHYIDALMAMPVKGQNSVQIFGDEDVEGINLPPRPFTYDDHPQK